MLLSGRGKAVTGKDIFIFFTAFQHDYNNSIKFFFIHVPSQQPQDQLQTQHSVDTSNYIMDKQHKVKD
jgi:hypothetical protein